MADVDAQTEADAALFFGSSFCFAYAMATATAAFLAAADAAAAKKATVVSGLSCCYSAVADADLVAKNQPAYHFTGKLLLPRFNFVYFYLFSANLFLFPPFFCFSPLNIPRPVHIHFLRQ